MPYDRSAFERATGLDRAAAMDPWGMPPASASRRDTEEMLSRVSRTEAESSDAYRRIEEHLRTVARRLDSAERSQSENNRAMNKTATEINIATREQAQAFDQLGSHVMHIGDRLERLERAQSNDGMKDAVKGLHQGLSRLADQITQTANQSAQQVSSISGNLEQLAGRLGQMRADIDTTTQWVEDRVAKVESAMDGSARRLEDRVAKVESTMDGAARRLENRIAAVEEETRDRFAAFAAETARTMDQRLAGIEKTAQFNTNALDHALEQLEAQAGLRAGDQAELQRRHAETDGAIGRIEESIEKLEAKAADPASDRRLDSIERALGSLVSRLETYDPAAPLEDTLRALTKRIDTIDKNHGELVDELRANLASGSKPAQPAPTEPPFDTAMFDANSFAGAASAFEAPPFPESPPLLGSEEFHAAAPFGAEPPPMPGHDPFAADAFSTGAFTPPVDAEHAAADENFLAAARRSARAAAEAEAPRGSKLGFAWNQGAAAQDGERPRYLVPVIIGGIIILALVAGIVLSQKMRAGQTGVIVEGPHAAKDAPAGNAPFTPAPDNSATQGPSQGDVNLPPMQQHAMREAPGRPGNMAPTGMPSAQQAQVNPPTLQALNKPVQPPSVNKGAVPTLDRVTQLANGGNAIAQTILGLKEVDGDGMPANPADGAKWLEKAAQQGNAVAQYRLGALYERGQGVTANPGAAAHWYQLAAGQGNRKAMHNLAVAFASGAAGKKDMAEAARWFAKASSLGLADSQFNLAVLYERGDGVPQSLLDAYKWYAIAASQGDTESKSRLGVLSSQLSDDDRNAAQKSAESFHAAPLNRAVNVPPEMADLSGN